MKNDILLLPCLKKDGQKIVLEIKVSDTNTNTVKLNGVDFENQTDPCEYIITTVFNIENSFNPYLVELDLNYFYELLKLRKINSTDNLIEKSLNEFTEFLHEKYKNEEYILNILNREHKQLKRQLNER